MTVLTNTTRFIKLHQSKPHSEVWALFVQSMALDTERHLFWELMEAKTKGLKELVRLSQRIHKEDLSWNKTPEGGNPYRWHGSLYLLNKHPELELPGRGLQVWTRKVLAGKGNTGSQLWDTNPRALSADITQLSSLCRTTAL